MDKIKVIFMGTSRFAAEILESLIYPHTNFNKNNSANTTSQKTLSQSSEDTNFKKVGVGVKEKYNIAAVFSQPDKKVGRKQELISGPVKLLAIENNIPLFQPDRLNEEEIERIKNINPDLIIVAAYGKILPENILQIPKYKSLNVHASLLPKYRGASPIQNALLHGEEKTGVTIMLMDEGVDTGDIISQKEINIEPDDTAENLTRKLAASGAELLIKTLPDYISGKIEPEKQDDSLATLCRLVKREDGLIDWNDTAKNIYNKFRAFQPWPGIYAFWENNGSPKRIKLVKISLDAANPEKKYGIGEIFESEEKISVQTGSGIIILEELQMEGKSPANAKSFINGYPNFVGSILK